MTIDDFDILFASFESWLLYLPFLVISATYCVFVLLWGSSWFIFLIQVTKNKITPNKRKSNQVCSYANIVGCKKTYISSPNPILIFSICYSRGSWPFLSAETLLSNLFTSIFPGDANRIMWSESYNCLMFFFCCWFSIYATLPPYDNKKNISIA